MNISKEPSEHIETIIPDFSDLLDQVPDISQPFYFILPLANEVVHFLETLKNGYTCVLQRFFEH